MNKVIEKFRKRRYDRLRSRGIRADADWEEEKHPRSSDGKFTSGSGSNKGNTDKRKTADKKTAEIKRPFLQLKNVSTFINRLSTAKNSLSKEENPWRVTDYKNKGSFNKYHYGAKLRMTEGGSTFAVCKDGDIVGVCHKKGDKTRGKELLKMAVDDGGDRLDAYEGLFDFYTKCGFEPVSWCKWDDEYAPHDWNEKDFNREDIVFFKYTGKKSEYESLKDFKKKVGADNSYDDAKSKRDSSIKGV